MCFSYKWLGERTKVVSIRDFKRYKKEPFNDIEVVKKLHELFNEADIIIAHNLNRFDDKVAKERFLFHKMTPPSPYFKIDTLTEARKFKNLSNSLNNLCKKLDLGTKTDEKHSDLWHGCINGCDKSWAKMEKYCKVDTDLLEKLYLELRPWISNHPNISNLSEDAFICPKCGSAHYQSRGTRKTNTGSYFRFQCQQCGGWFSERCQEKEAFKPVYKSI